MTIPTYLPHKRFDDRPSPDAGPGLPRATLFCVAPRLAR
jgi:hypothetical protein